MAFTMRYSGKLLNTTCNLDKWTAKILKEAFLSAQQRKDLEMILEAIKQFSDFAHDETVIIDNFAEAVPSELQRVRHKLLNHLNIIVGFTALIIRDLPDNLLLQMMTIRKINETAETLIKEIKALR